MRSSTFSEEYCQKKFMNRKHTDRPPELRISITTESVGGGQTSAGFVRSVESLLALALREVSAEECSFYEYSESKGTLSLQKRLPKRSAQKSSGRLETARIELPEDASAWLLNLRDSEYIPSLAFRVRRSSSFPEVIENSLESLLIVPLIEGESFVGLLNFGWRSATELEESRRRAAEEIAASVASVLLRSKQASLTIHLANRLHELQAELADGKITDRARGILLEDSRRFDLGGLMRQHVDRVLEGTNGVDLLAQHVAKLEAEVGNRRIINRAKQFLQEKLQLSEEQAYLRLRNTSRKSRRPLLDIAGEVLGPLQTQDATTHL
jgi:signal transduction protein with GAF and PtsI domain